MKKGTKITLIIISVLAIFLATYLIRINAEAEKLAMDYRDKAYDYLCEKYGKEAKFTDYWSYYDSMYAFYAYFDDEDNKFQVRYFEYGEYFMDDYVYKLLTKEISALLENICGKYYTDVSCTTNIRNSLHEKELWEECYQNQQDLIQGIQPKNKVYANIDMHQSKDVVDKSDFANILEDISKLDFEVDTVRFRIYDQRDKLISSEEYEKVNGTYRIVKPKE